MTSSSSGNEPGEQIHRLSPLGHIALFAEPAQSLSLYTNTITIPSELLSALKLELLRMSARKRDGRGGGLLK